jgi:predicted permease
MPTLLHDVRFALRQLARNPVFTLIAVLSLAVGIGANTAIFSVMNAALLKALPVRNPHELVILTDPNRGGGGSGLETGVRTVLSYPEFAQLRDHTTTMSGLCAAEVGLNHWQVRIDDSPQEEAPGKLVSENYFSVLSVEPVIGRLFTQKDATGPGNDPYAVISYDFWQRRFGGNVGVLGTPINLYGTSLSIIGVAAPGFRGETVGENPDLWLPMMMEPMAKPGRDWLHEDLSKEMAKAMWLGVFGRLKPGVTLAGAQAEVDVLFRGIIETGYPTTLPPDQQKEVLDQHILVHHARTGAFVGRDVFSRQLMVLLAVAGLVLLIACANVANLLLARAAARSKEIGIRLSIGASRSRLIRQFLTESLLLSAVGGALGLLVAGGASRLLAVLLSGPKSRFALSTDLDLAVLAFTAGMTVLTGVLFGLAPAIKGTRISLSDSLKEAGRGITDSGRRLTFQKSLVIAQVALSLVLVVGAGLFLRTLWNLQSVQLGYPKDNLLLVRVNGLTAGYKDVRLANLYRDIADRLRVLPGVRGLAYSENGIFNGTDSGDEIAVEGFTPITDDDRSAAFDRISPAYFSTLGVPLLLGREFGLQDTASSPRVCVINQTFARHFFAAGNPIGKHITQIFGYQKSTMEIVGVAKDARDHSLREDVPYRFYVPVEQSLGGIVPSIYFAIRTSGEPEQMLNTVRKTILDINANLPITTATSLGELIDGYNAPTRMIARLCAIFGVIALMLAAIGLYGVLSYGVARRTNEIGVRMALGADKTRVIGMILRETSVMIAIGVIAGVITTTVVTRLVATQLFGLSAFDLPTVAVAICVLAAVSLVAGYIPAMRAARVNPVNALRHE